MSRNEKKALHSFCQIDIKLIQCLRRALVPFVSEGIGFEIDLRLMHQNNSVDLPDYSLHYTGS